MKKIILSIVTIAAITTTAIANEAVSSIETTKAESKNEFLERIHFKGDLRLRYESKEKDIVGKDPVYQNRYRLRLVSAIDLTDNLTFDAGMRSGYGNPTSGNQTFLNDDNLQDYFMQSLRVNLLGLTYSSSNSTLKVGRQPYMMYRPISSQLVWDNDISMNGVNYQYKDDKNILTVGINQPTYAENVTARDNVNLFIAQYVRTTKLESSKLNLGAGVYYYDGLKGNTAMYYNKDMGNTMVGGVYANDYHIAEGFAELKFKDVFGKPVAVAAGVAYNMAASNNNFGYDVAFKVGKAKEVGDWQLKYSYTDLQEDAVLGAHSDSDNFGGGTAAKGHAIRTKYKFGKNTYLAGTWFFNKRYASKDGIAADSDYKRVQLDAIIKF